MKENFFRTPPATLRRVLVATGEGAEGGLYKVLR